MRSVQGADQPAPAGEVLLGVLVREAAGGEPAISAQAVPEARGAGRWSGMGGRLGTPFAPKIIDCVDCGGSALRKPQAYLCWSCSRVRAHRRHQIWLRKKRSDPEFRAKIRAWQRAWLARRMDDPAWAAARRESKRREPRQPIPCHVCAEPLPRIRGRTVERALCQRCQREHRAYMSRLWVRMRAKRRAA